MSEQSLKYHEVTHKLGVALRHKCLNDEQSTAVKKIIENCYDRWGEMLHQKTYMNWGLFDKKILHEFCQLGINTSQICDRQDINSHLLSFYLIRPLLLLKPNEKKLLDIGCGNGIGLRLNSKILDSGYALGIDRSHQLIENANQHMRENANIHFMQADAESLPLSSNSFDIITNLESSHLYPNIESFFKEVSRVLKPGGFFCYADINNFSNPQTQVLHTHLKACADFKVLIKEDITRKVQRSIFERLIINEIPFLQYAYTLFGPKEDSFVELNALALAMGMNFLPWWMKLCIAHPSLKKIAKEASQANYWQKKRFFYYLLQKKN